MDTFRKWLNKPKADDKSLLARFYHADRSLTAVASELDSFDGRAEPDRCSRLVSRLRQGQDKVLAITNLIMEELLGEDRDPRAFRAKFPEEVLQENLAGQLWFGAECLAAGSSIMNREQESKEMRPLAQAVTKSLGNVRNLLRDQCLRNNVPNSKTLHLDHNDSTTEQLYESLKIFDRLFAEFELRYVSAMVQVKSKHEYEMQEFICVLYSETLQRALKTGLLEQDKVDAFDPALMFSIPRLAIIAGLVIYAKGPLNMDMSADQLSEMFRPFRTILIKIRDLLRTLNKNELCQLERLLCTNEDIQLKVPVGTSSIEAPSPDQQNNNSSSNTSTTANNCDDVGTNSATAQKLIEQRNNNNTTATSTAAVMVETPSPSTSPKKVFNPTDSYASLCPAVSSPSISSVSAVSSVTSASPTPSIASTSSVESTSTTSPADWSDDEDENGVDDDHTDEDGELPKELDIVSADCASGYLIPNTNFGNLLQPQEVPLTDNFIASEDEFGNHRSVDDDGAGGADIPSTSAAGGSLKNNMRRLHVNDSSEESEQLTIKASNLDNNETIATPKYDKLDKVSTGSSESSNKHNLSSGSTSRRHRSHHEHSCSISTGSSDSSSRSHSHHHSHSHGHHHHHHSHHHHHHRNRSHHHHSMSKRCSLDVDDMIKEESNHTHATTTTTTSPSTPTAVHHDTSSGDSSTSSSLSDGDPHEVSLALRAAGRMKFKSTENLLHRLFVCIAGVADQLQTNFASDLRQILRSVFLMNMSVAQEELDLPIPEKTKESELFEFRASENDVIQESAGSNQSIYSAEEANPELDNVFNNSGSSGCSSNRHSAGATIQRGNTIDLGDADGGGRPTAATRNNAARSRSLGDQENNESSTSSASSSNNRRLSTYISGRRLSSPSRNHHNGNAHLSHHRNRNNSVGSNSPSSSSSESNSPVIERVASAFPHSPRHGGASNNNNASNASTTSAATAAVAAAIVSPPPPTQSQQSTNSRLSPPAWIPDDKAPRCMSCRTPFTAFRRRHHCRNCGGVFCGVCSNASAPLPKYGLTKAVRVCRECYVREVRANTAAAAQNGRGTASAVHAPQHSAATTTAGGS